MLTEKRSGGFNDGNGGMADIDFYQAGERRKEMENRLARTVKEYFAEHPDPEYLDLEPYGETFFVTLLILMDDEKEYKKMLKKGYPFMVVYKENEKSPYENIIGYQTKAQLEKFIQEKNYLSCREYQTLEDFDIQ